MTFHVNFIESLKFTTISKLSKTFLEFTKQVFQNFTFILCHNNLWGPSTNSDSLYIPPKVKSPQILLLIYFPRHVTELPQRKPLRFAPENNFQICPRENIFPKDRHFIACLLLNNTKTLSTWMFCISSCLFEFAFSAQLLWKECTCQVQREKRKTGKILEEF